MLEHAEEGDEDVDDQGRLAAEAEAEDEDEAAEEGAAEHVERREVEGAPDVDALGAVVHLVEPAPQRVNVVHRPVPGVDSQLQREEAADHLRPEGQSGGVEQPVGAERAVPDQRGEGRDGEIGEGRERRPDPPEAKRREGAAGQKQLGEDEAHEKREGDLMVETEHRVLHFC